MGRGLSVLFSLALILYGLRMYTRIRPAFVLATPDYIITMAFLCELVIFTSLMIAINHGLGPHTFYALKDGQTTVLRCIFAVELVAFWTTSLSRISIGTLLLRFDISKTWKAVLWILIYIQLAVAIGSSVFSFLMCRPVHALWKDVPNAICLSLHVLKIWGYSSRIA
ncbi:hypothetical protein K469DRAFT_567509 [Zopfia rhizophila CBS 207.26]|uniref:Rhodopsin domain-containing protein n=1 Tax=Zopfia rhizophila CBS 207.26 TaxID=1314779 RepID=A0A6A6EA45_9PEZI|nr:hypothetical protein K469DRAFT_567509 [Zopfia rhizophila CBS 207.26]